VLIKHKLFVKLTSTPDALQTSVMAGDPIYKAFGNAVCTRRKALGLTQAQLASKVKMSRASIANIESGRQNVLLHHVYALAAALEFTKVGELLPPPPQQKSAGEELRMMVSNQALSLSEHEEAQVADLITNALAPRRGLKAGS
jgi:transcriptional regulator with XRE-family HTH domain